jgi:hypothetical protein
MNLNVILYAMHSGSIRFINFFLDHLQTSEESQVGDFFSPVTHFTNDLEEREPVSVGNRLHSSLLEWYSESNNIANNIFSSLVMVFFTQQP